MPVGISQIDGKWRIVEPPGSDTIAQTSDGNAVDGGGHSSRADALAQMRAINSRSTSMYTAPPLASAIRGPRGGAWCLRALYPLISSDAPVTEIHVAMEGSWDGHASGPFTLTADDFAQIIANFEASPNPIPLDYEHSTTWASKAPACGWVHELEMRRDADGKAHLWASKVELGQDAAEHIRKGEYRFSSGVFEFDAPDPESGESMGTYMSSLALTNVPFLRGQNPIALSFRAAQRGSHALELSMELTKERLMGLLDQVEGDTVTLEQLEALAEAGAAIENPDASPEAGEEAPMGGAMPDEEEMPMSAEPAGDASVEASEEVAAADGMMDGEAAAAVVSSLATALGVDVPAVAAMITENMDAVVSALQGGLDAPAAEAPLSDSERAEMQLALSARDDALTALKRQLDASTKALSRYREQEADELVDTLIEGGVILHDARPKWRELALSNREQFVELSASLKQVVPLAAHATSIAPTEDKTPKPDEIEIDEDDPMVKRQRLNLSHKSRAFQDRAIRKLILRRTESAQAGA